MEHIVNINFLKFKKVIYAGRSKCSEEILLETEKLPNAEANPSDKTKCQEPVLIPSPKKSPNLRAYNNHWFHQKMFYDLYQHTSTTKGKTSFLFMAYSMSM